ncbi:alpha/beta hydrolase [Saccharomonospora saliphila]|uniref:alpha/beta hydrolase n=1 Tax=Saccharomonospora saliphila TaxID=369829 RepID=UPI00037C7026|nr:alpha/beta hydrolase [Saccharomonospora saliphila]
MTTFVLIPGAGSAPWYWHRVAPLLGERGHDVVAPDLPCDDDTAGLAAYADAVAEAVVGTVGAHSDVVLVAHSFGAFTAPLVCDRLPVRLLVLVAGMIPRPGESAASWWEATGQPRAQRECAEREGRDPDAEPDLGELFLHDVPEHLARRALVEGERDQSGTPFGEPWPRAAWPDVPTRVLLFRQDRLFPAPLQRSVARARLGVEPEELDGGHLALLSRPRELADRLLTYAAGTRS